MQLNFGTVIILGCYMGKRTKFIDLEKLSDTEKNSAESSVWLGGSAIHVINIVVLFFNASKG